MILCLHFTKLMLLRKHAKESQNRCGWCDSAHHHSGNWAEEDISQQHRPDQFFGTAWQSSFRYPNRVLCVGADPQICSSATAQRFGPGTIELREVLGFAKDPQTVKGRSALYYWANWGLGMTTVEISRRLRISQSAVSRAFLGGERIAAQNHVHLWRMTGRPVFA